MSRVDDNTGTEVLEKYKDELVKPAPKPEVHTRGGGVDVTVGSPVFLKYQGRAYRGIIKKIRAKSKMFLLEFKPKIGPVRQVWKHKGELYPATREDAVIPEVKAHPGGVNGQTVSEGKAGS